MASPEGRAGAGAEGKKEKARHRPLEVKRRDEGRSLRALAPKDLLSARAGGLLVVNPGSANLRLGFATADRPEVVPHCVAFRREAAEGQAAGGAGAEAAGISPHCVPPEERLGDAAQGAAYWRLLERVRQGGGGGGGVGGGPRVSVKTQMLGRTAQEEPAGAWWADVGPRTPVLVGRDALRAPPHAPYVPQFPMRRGRLNTWTYELHEIRQMMRVIWERALEDRLGCGRAERAETSVMLVVPDAFSAAEIRLLVDLALADLGFREAVVQLESVAAVFCHGCGSACVVNLGAQSTNVVCVEDGLAVPASRVFLPFGGDDVSQFLWWLVFQGGAADFLADADPCQASQVLDNLKARVCKFYDDEKDIVRRHQGDTVAEFAVRDPRRPGRLVRHRANLGATPALAALGYFEPDLMGASPAAQVPGGVNFLGEGGAPPPARGPPGSGAAGVLEDDFAQEAAASSRAALGKAATATANAVYGEGQFDAAAVARLAGQITQMQQGRVSRKKFSLEKAIVESVSRLNRPKDAAKKFYTNLVVVGGGGMAQGLVDAVEYRVLHGIDPAEEVELVNVNAPKALPGAPPTERDAAAWRGGAILAAIEPSREHWLRRDEWNEGGCVPGRGGRKLGSAEPLLAQMLHYCNALQQ